MMKERTTSRFSVISKVLVFTFLMVAVACEDLTDSLSPRDNIIGTWKCQENGGSAFLVEITADPSSLSGVKIYNFNLIGDKYAVKATVSGTSISIDKQVVDGFTILGSGTISANYEKINLSYTVDDGGGKENYTAVLTQP